METLTVRQAFDALILFLEEYYRMTKSDDIGLILGILSLQMWSDDMTADPAGWYDWMKCVQMVLFPDTMENRHMLEDLISNQANYLGADQWHGDWFAKLLPDGRQLWAYVRAGEIQYGGIRNTPKEFNPKTGLTSPSDP